MAKIIHYLILVLLLTLSIASFAKQELRIGVGNFPPFFIEKGERGLFLEITNEIFKHLPEYQIKYVFMSNHRLAYEINSGQLIDVACNIFANSKVNAFLSEPLFRYTDVAITRKDKHYQINSIDDLQDLSIAAYQGAKDLLGEKYRLMAESNSQYSEHAHPKDTTFLMVSGAKDVRVGDINIFLHDIYNPHIRAKKPLDVKDFTIHPLWANVYSYMAFKDEAIRNKVNKVIKTLKQDGSIEAIYTKYHIQ
ncbi:hypothetical protein tinsulaeT_15840 [Thalassotalea insulae]|uniref:Solute-binding protein family 3/N-terminal domain-containing protein n=1 Tax=Thalassotalea insulae TaxID=2056778 RepID=A0ABQ6GSD7_9GAMM|nr:transporter substrate-binding domain-containing protein [Thalassotalea insulae]GLX78244.1 hypothetical protein tinsulaeT_15840 [Thalassotalea insulae]